MDGRKAGRQETGKSEKERGRRKEIKAEDKGKKVGEEGRNAERIVKRQDGMKRKGGRSKAIEEGRREKKEEGKK